MDKKLTLFVVPVLTIVMMSSGILSMVLGQEVFAGTEILCTSLFSPNCHPHSNSATHDSNSNSAPHDSNAGTLTNTPHGIGNGNFMDGHNNGNDCFRSGHDHGHNFVNFGHNLRNDCIRSGHDHGHNFVNIRHH